LLYLQQDEKVKPNLFLFISHSLTRNMLRQLRLQRGKTQTVT